VGQRATVRAADYTFFYGKANENHPGTGFFVTTEWEWF